MKNEFSNKYGEKKTVTPYITGYAFLNPTDYKKSLEEYFKCLPVLFQGIEIKEHYANLYYIEMENLPMFNLCRKLLPNEENIRETFNLYYWTTRPNGIDIEFFCKLENCKLKTNKYTVADMFSEHIRHNDKKEYIIQLEYESIDLSDKIKKKCSEFTLGFINNN